MPKSFWEQCHPLPKLSLSLCHLFSSRLTASREDKGPNKGRAEEWFCRNQWHSDILKIQEPVSLSYIWQGNPCLVEPLTDVLAEGTNIPLSISSSSSLRQSWHSHAGKHRDEGKGRWWPKWSDWGEGAAEVRRPLFQGGGSEQRGLVKHRRAVKDRGSKVGNKSEGGQVNPCDLLTCCWGKVVIGVWKWVCYEVTCVAVMILTSLHVYPVGACVLPWPCGGACGKGDSACCWCCSSPCSVSPPHRAAKSGSWQMWDPPGSWGSRRSPSASYTPLGPLPLLEEGQGEGGVKLMRSVCMSIQRHIFRMQARADVLSKCPPPPPPQLLLAFLLCSLFDDSLDVGALRPTSVHTQSAIRLLRRHALQKADLISAKELWDQVSETQRNSSFVQRAHWG